MIKKNTSQCGNIEKDQLFHDVMSRQAEGSQDL